MRKMATPSNKKSTEKSAKLMGTDHFMAPDAEKTEPRVESPEKDLPTTAVIPSSGSPSAKAPPAQPTVVSQPTSPIPSTFSSAPSPALPVAPLSADLQVHNPLPKVPWGVRIPWETFEFIKEHDESRLFRKDQRTFREKFLSWVETVKVDVAPGLQTFQSAAAKALLSQSSQDRGESEPDTQPEMPAEGQDVEDKPPTGEPPKTTRPPAKKDPTVWQVASNKGKESL